MDTNPIETKKVEVPIASKIDEVMAHADAVERGAAVAITQALAGEAKPVVIPTVEKKPEERMTGKEDPYAYTITDKTFGELKVLNSANGWWISKGKVESLIQAYKYDCPDEEACAFAGISIHQLRHFNELHLDFSRIKAACKQLPFLKARKAIVEGLENDKSFALDYMARKKKDEFSSRTEHTGADGKDLIPLTEEQEKRLQSLAYMKHPPQIMPAQPSITAPSTTVAPIQNDIPRANTSTPTGN